MRGRARAWTSAAARRVSATRIAPVSAAALTIYDMLKALDKGIEIREIVLQRKSGGKSGEYRRAKR